MYSNFTYRDMSNDFARETLINNALDAIYKEIDDEHVTEYDLFIAPPDPAVLTDEDSGDEDYGGTIDNLNYRQLQATSNVRQYGDQNRIDHIQNENLDGEENRTWVKGEMESFLSSFPEPDYSQFQDKSATQLFELFFDNSIVDLLVKESNKYAQSKNQPNPNISSDEIRCFIGVLILSGYNTVPSKRLYWSSKLDTRKELICQAMKRNRFDEILRFMHCVDNKNLDSTDKMWKIRPMMNIIKQNFLKYFVPEQNLSYAESMVKYYGKHSCKQFIKGKPIQIGYKVWCLCTTNGYLVNFDVYQGKDPFSNSIFDMKFGKSTAPLIKMIDEFDINVKKMPFHFTFDKLFAGFNLLNFLRNQGYGGTGTIRANYIPKNDLFTSNEMKKKQKRGYFESAICKEDGILVCKWVDNSVVTLASNVYGVSPVGPVKRYSQKDKKSIQIQRPFIVAKYNETKFGVNRMDENIGSYRINIRNKKWYWALLSWMVDICVQNAWQLKRNSGSKVSQLDFRREIVVVYLNKYKDDSIGSNSKARLSKSKIYDDIRYDGLKHYVKKIERKRRCVGFYCKKKTSSVRTQCGKCDVGLCIICFENYHTIND